MSPWTTVLLALLIGFLLGSIPASYIAGRLRGIDLREHGSGNLGATNVYRVLGPGYAVPVLVVDLLKGALAVALGSTLLPELVRVPDLIPLLCGFAAVLGHSLSPFVGFRGGKGVATAAGVFLTLAPWAAVPAFAVWLFLLLLTRIMSIASIAGAAVLPMNLLVFEIVDREERFRWATVCAALLIAVWVVWRHRSNLERLREGRENALW
jgi:glycerol-3-phosphate acyltransferase PlsY